VLLKLVKGGPSHEIKADHLVGSLGRLFAGETHDENTGDDRQIDLDGYAVSLMAQKMSTAKKLLDHPEVKFDRPAEQIQSRNDFCRNIQVVRGDSQDPITTRCRQCVLATSAIEWVDLHHHDFGYVVRPLLGLFSAESNDLIANDVFFGGLLVTGRALVV
jgi:hypothetical protein